MCGGHWRSNVSVEGFGLLIERLALLVAILNASHVLNQVLAEVVVHVLDRQIYLFALDAGVLIYGILHGRRVHN